MKSRFIIIILLMAFTSSCQTVDKKVVPPPETGEGDTLSLKVKEWERYMDLIGEGEIPIDTILSLTEGYLEAKDMRFKKEMEEYENRLALYNNGKIKEAPTEPSKDYASLINHFKTLSTRYRYGKGADAVRYILGYAMYEQGERDDAVRVLEELARNYPDSEYLPEVSFRLGEFYFETGQMGDAINAYNRILENPGSVFYDKALYKIGWAYYKLDDFKKGADMFTTILDIRWGGDFRAEGLTEDAVSSVVMSLSHFKDTKEAVEYMKSKGERGYTQPVLLRLGDQLTEETRYDSALIVYKYLTETFPDNREIPFVYEKMAEIYERTGDEDKELETRWVMVRGYNPLTHWYRKNLPSGSGKVDDLISKEMLSVSKRYHYKGKKDDKYLEKAIEGYRMFIASFPQTPDLTEGNLLLAEALFDAKMYRDAAEEYEKVAALYKEGPERGEIAHSAFLSYEVIFYQSMEKREETLRSAGRLLEIYGSDLSKSGRLEKVRYSISDMYSRTGEFAKARESLMPLVRDKESIPAYKRIAELYLLEGNLVSAEEVYARVAEMSKDTAFKETLAQLRYRLAEENLKEGRYKEAALKFNQSFLAYPGSKIGEAALIKMGYIRIQGKEMDDLEEVVRRLVKEYPGSEGAVSLLVEAGRGIEREDPIKAAGLYEYASSLASHKEDSLKLSLAAAILYQENGDYSKAEGLLKRYLRNKGTPLRDEADARYRLGCIQIEAGRKSDGIEMLQSVLELKGEIDKQLITKTRFILAKERQGVYLEANLTQPFEKTLKKKTKLLESLLQDYSYVAKFGATELLSEVYFRMGLILENFRDSLLEAERPKDLTEEEMNEYKFLLEEKAYPYEEQAVKAYEMSLEAGRKQMIQNEWMGKSLDRLIYLRPAIYKKEAPLKEDEGEMKR